MERKLRQLHNLMLGIISLTIMTGGYQLFQYRNSLSVILFFILLIVEVFVIAKINYIKNTNYKLLNQIVKETNVNYSNISDYVSALIDQIKTLTDNNIKLTNSVNNIKPIQQDMNQFNVTQTDLGESINSISMGAQEQAVSIQNIMELFSKLSTLVNGIEEKSGDMIDDMIKVVTKINHGNNSITLLSNKLSEVTCSSNIVDSNIKELITNIKEVNVFSDLIKGISETIKLLSLNARIEAAKAGVAGAGFAVIAEEVNKLAIRTIETTKNINGTISNINNAASKVVNSMQTSEESINQANINLENTQISFNEIEASVENATLKVNYVQDEIEKVTSTKNDMLPYVENIAAVTEEYSASTEQINAIFEEQMVSSKNILLNFENCIKE